MKTAFWHRDEMVALVAMLAPYDLLHLVRKEMLTAV